VVRERGQATVLLLVIAVVVMGGVLALAAMGNALGARGRYQRVADLAAVSGARAMRDAYPRLFEAPELRPGVPNPRHLDRDEYLVIGRTAAVRAAAANAVRLSAADVAFPDASFAPTSVRVSVRRPVAVRVAAGSPRRRLVVRARATAELSPAAGGDSFGYTAQASGGGYDGPLAYRMGKPMRPDVAEAFDRMAAAARDEAGIALAINSAFRSDAEQARLFAAHPDPKWVAPPGTSLHRYATELDLAPPAAYAWLVANCRRFGFIHRYAWEPWHFGYGKNPRDVPAQYERGSWEPPDGDNTRIFTHLPSFVPEAFRDPIARAALHWNVPQNLLAAQLYAESGFNPFARSPAGALGIAQFMPGTAAGYGLDNPFDARKAIDAQAHLMHDLLAQFGSYSLALAAYNAGPGAVAGCRCVPPFSETRGYVARILALMGSTGDLPAPSMQVRLVE
jgi:transglycosylase-like protein with SLT domain/D-alanyl-D-alanine carboxypeptidase-like protein